MTESLFLDISQFFRSLKWIFSENIQNILRPFDCLALLFFAFFVFLKMERLFLFFVLAVSFVCADSTFCTITYSDDDCQNLTQKVCQTTGCTTVLDTSFKTTCNETSYTQTTYSAGSGCSGEGVSVTQDLDTCITLVGRSTQFTCEKKSHSSSGGHLVFSLIFVVLSVLVALLKM